MTMTMDSSKKVLNIAAVINFICGVPMTLLGIFGLSSAAAAYTVPEIADSLGEAGPMAAVLIFAASLIVLFSGILTIVEGILDKRAAKDPTKVMPVWWISIVLLVTHGISVVLAAMNGTLGIGSIAGLALTAFVFWAADFMKKELGK